MARLKILTVSTIAGVALVCGLALIAGQAQRAAKPVAVDVILAGPGDLCATDRARISPDMRQILFMPDFAAAPHLPPGAAFEIADASCLLDGVSANQCIRKRISRGGDSGGQGAIPTSGAAWERDGRLFVWNAQRGLVLMSASGDGAVETLLPPEPAGRAIAIQGAPSRDEVLAEIKALRGRGGAGAMAWLFQPSGPGATMSKDPVLGTAYFEIAGAKARTDIDISSFDRFVVVDRSLGAANWALAGKSGYVSSSPGAELLDLPPRPGADVVLDPRSGRALGVTDASGAVRLPHLSTAQRAVADVIARDTADGRRVLRNVSIDPNSRMGVVAYVVDAQSRGFRVVEWDHEGRIARSRAIDCPSTPALGRPSLAKVTTHFLELGSGGRALPAIKYATGAPASTMVVYLSGGPLAPRFLSAETSRTFRYLASGADVLAPALSGGSDLGQEGRTRLSVSPIQALQADSADLARYLSAAGYDTVVVHAESFAAGVALDLAKRLAPTKVKLILTSPWLSYVAPAKYAQEVERFERFERVQIGLRTPADRDAYFAWIAHNLNARDAGDTLIVHGGRDGRIGQGAIAEARKKGLATVVEVPAATHETAQISPQTWDAINDFLAR